VETLVTIVLRLTYARINKQREELDQTAIEKQYSLQELLDIGDKSPVFMYSL
jgi:hypothetical protein